MADTRVRCNHCGRRAIGVDRITGQLVPHRTKPGRKGHYCPGSGKLPKSTPQAVA